MRKILITLCMVTSLTLQAQAPLKKVTDAQAQTMVMKINQTAAKIQTLTCQFTQVKTLRFLNDKMTSQGRMCYEGPDKLRWEYTTPYNYAFILNGQKVHIKTAKRQQTIDIRQSRLFQGIARVMMNSVTGKSLTSDKDFACTMLTRGDDWVAELVPQKKEMKQLFTTIRLHFDGKLQMVSQVEMTEKNGDTTIITLKDVKTNGKIDAQMFAER